MEKEKNYQFYALSASDTPQEFRYIGVTSKSINSRFSQHKYCATHPEKCSLPVHKWMASVYKNGGSIIWTKIDSCLEQEWEIKEIELIQKYKNLGYKLFNLDKGGRGVITLEKRSKSSTQRSIEGHYKKIVLFDKLGNLIEICESIKYAVEKYNLSKTSVGNVLSGRSKTTKNYYIITYENYISPNFDILKYIQEKTDSTKKNKLVYQYTLDGIIMNCFKTQTEAKKYGFDDGAIRRAIKNKTIYKNSYWTNTNTININDFEKEYKYLYNNIKFKTLHEIAEFVDFKDCTISNALRENKLIKGFIITRI